MPAVSSIMLAVGAAGLATQGVSAYEQSKSRKEATAASIQAENLREQQMNLEDMRKKRELIRQTQAADATALSRSVNQGAGVEGSELFGAYGQVQGAYGRALNAEEQNRDIGAGLFQANRDLASAQGRTATWEGFGKLGASLTSNAEMIGKIGSSLWSPTSMGTAGNPRIPPFQTSVTGGIWPT